MKLLFMLLLTSCGFGIEYQGDSAQNTIIKSVLQKTHVKKTCFEVVDSANMDGRYCVKNVNVENFQQRGKSDEKEYNLLVVWWYNKCSSL